MDKVEGRTYSLDGGYYPFIAEQVDKLAEAVGGLDMLDKLLSGQVASETPAGTWGQRIKAFCGSKTNVSVAQNAGSSQNTPGKKEEFEELFSHISSRISTLYTPQLGEFISNLPHKHDNHDIFAISIRGYHLRMLHIEVLNRLMRDNFGGKAHKIVILPHCLRDFRADECRFVPGDVDHVCKGCTGECFINRTRIFLKSYPGYHLYISQITDLDKLFTLARKRYGDIGLLGVACVPELYEGIALARKMGIPALGVPLNYNRCSRWLGEAQYTNFNLEQLKKIIFNLRNSKNIDSVLSVE